MQSSSENLTRYYEQLSHTSPIPDSHILPDNEEGLNHISPIPLPHPSPQSTPPDSPGLSSEFSTLSDNGEPFDDIFMTTSHQPSPRSTPQTSTSFKSSSSASSTPSISLDLDILSEEKLFSPRRNYAQGNQQHADANEEWGDLLVVGEIVFDEVGKAWKCHSCFCELDLCNGKALRPMEGKSTMDSWDRGRPES